MSFLSNKELWFSWSALWNGNLSIADEIIAPNFVAYFAPIGNSPAEVHGPDALKQWIGATVKAFTDYSFTTTVGPIADDDYVAGRWLFRAIYQGGIPGASSGAVGKLVEYAGMDLFRIEAGKIVAYWLCADTLQLLQQVGVIPS
jgi:predicted ester cyclase